MRFQKRFKIMFILCTMVILLITNLSFPADDRNIISDVGGISANGWQMPIDVESKHKKLPTQEEWLKLGWQSFIALSWPAETGTGATGGQPNTNLNITDPKAAAFPTVWMTFLGKKQVFQQNANDPGKWSKPSLPLHRKKDPETGKMIPIIGALSKSTHKHADLGEFDEAMTNRPLIDQNGNYVLYEIRLNQSEFEYIKTNMYYNANIQKEAFKNIVPPYTFKHFPDGVNHMPSGLPDFAEYGATEIKASWRILITDPKAANPDILSRYYKMKAFVETPDKKVKGPYTLGLVGLHILRLTPSTHTTWFWASFEQIDNVKVFDPIPNRLNGKPLTPSFNLGPGTQGPTYYPHGYSYRPQPIVEGDPLPAHQPVGVSRVYQIPSDVESVNATYQAQLKGTPWQYYQMVNTLNPSTTKTPYTFQGFHEDSLPFYTPFYSTVYLNTDVMVNTSMETYTQFNTNCITCHQFGRPLLPGTVNPQDVCITFTFLLEDAQYPAITLGPQVTNQISQSADKQATILSSNATIPSNYSWYSSPNQKFILILQTDGNLVLYQVQDSQTLSEGTSINAQYIWDANKANNKSDRLQVQSDGNLVMYPENYPTNPTLWSWSGWTPTASDANLYLFNNGALVLYNGTNPVWTISPAQD